MVLGRGSAGSRHGTASRGASAVVAAAVALAAACGGVPEECEQAARLLAPAAIALVDQLPAGQAAVPSDDLREAIDERDGRTVDQVLLELNRVGLGGVQPAPGQDPEEVRTGLKLAREADCEVGDLRPTLAEAFEAAAADAQGPAADRYRAVAEALRPAG